MASSGTWGDFDLIRHGIKNNTVDKLKQILSGLNEECGIHLSKSGKKQEIIDRIISALDSWRANNNEEKWIKAKSIIHQVRNAGIYAPSRAATAGLPPPAHAYNNTYTTNGLVKPAAYHTTSSTTTVGRYDPYAPPRKATTSTPAPVASSSSSPKPNIRFKESPFFRVDQIVSGIVECPESISATDRRQQTLTYLLTPDQLVKLKASGSKYQLRLFCTSSLFYTGTATFRTTSPPCPIEFPPTCEVRVNNVQLTANLKGLKKKPGTAPPPDLGKYVRYTTAQNRVEIVYVNSQQPVQSKKYFLVVMLVEVTGVEQLVKQLKVSRYRSPQEIKQKMVESLGEDDDIIAGPQKMSLKCPLSFMRVNTPCRSSKCVHSQCFDATSWYSMMEQTTTWLCPVCERVLDYRDLIIDGYFDEILKETPESVEDVVVEADGEWHTSDNKYGSAQWKARHSPVSSTPSSSRNPPSGSPSVPNPKPTSDGSSQANGKVKAPNVEIFVLDSDDEDEGRVKRELSPSYASSGNQSFEAPSARLPPQSQTQTQSQSSNVIDLTLDSDDEEAPPRATMTTGKRKAETDITSPTEEIWKKSRYNDNDRVPPTARRSSPRSEYSSTEPHRSAGHQLPPVNGAPVMTVPSTSRYPSSSFPGNTLPPVYNYGVRGTSSSGSLQLPPLPPAPSSTGYQLPRANGTSGTRW